MKTKLFFCLVVSCFIIMIQSCQPPVKANIPVARNDTFSYMRYVNADNTSEEWQMYKEMSGFGAYKFEFSAGLKGYKYEVKILTFRDGSQTDSLYFDARKICGQFRSSNDKINDFKFYTYKKSNSEEIFRMDPDRERTFSIYLETDNDHTYKWTILHNMDNNSTNLTTDVWYPVATFGQEPHIAGNPEKCAYCMLPDARFEYNKWHEKFNLAHYYIVLIRFIK